MRGMGVISVNDINPKAGIRQKQPNKTFFLKQTNKQINK
jgi:hypothetical protein